MKISELCKMIQDAIHSGKYPLDEQQKHFASSLKVINKSGSEDMKSSDIKIEVSIENLYTLNNYIPSIRHLPGVIEIDVLDSFKMLSRRLGRVEEQNRGTGLIEKPNRIDKIANKDSNIKEG
ncbi:MAG: hypothetical protein M3162_04845 [Thermoproteota archaeon]|nr:hypothetical protein [Thermoproteota archaeon]